jgi:plastocyanin domain-containing protein
MTIDKVLIALFSLSGIALTYWFFLMKKDTLIEVTDSVDILVKGGYIPASISIPKGKTTKLNFTRQDPSGCLEEIVMSDFKIKKYLPLNQSVSIEITPEKSGIYPFSCGMNMFHGKVIVH